MPIGEPDKSSKAIEIQAYRESEDHYYEYQLLISGSVAEDVEVSEDPINRTYYDVYCEREEVIDALLSFSLSDFLAARVIDIDVPYTVDWNPAIGDVAIQYDPEEKTSSLSIRFSRVTSWYGWPFAFDEYYRTLNNVMNYPPVWTTELAFPAANFSIDSSFSLRQELYRCSQSLKIIHSEVITQLKAQKNSVEVSFDFPEEVRVPCEQYLLYFVQFLKDLGVQATADLRHEAGKVLFAVTPADKETALDNIRTALQTYLQLASSPFDTDSTVEYEIAGQRLAANVDHLKSQVRLANAELRLANATIQQQQITIDRLLTNDVVLESLKTADSTAGNDEPERLLGGTVALTTFDKYGVRVNLGEVFRKLRRLFSEDKGED